MTNATATRNYRPDPVDSESEWEVFLNSKKEAMSRMKTGRLNALRNLGEKATGGRSIVSELSDDREAAGTFRKGAETRDAAPETTTVRESDLDTRKLIEIFTIIKKRKWDDLLELIETYPRSVSIPCPKNIQSTAKGNLMLHEACRNNPPLRVISALVDECPDAVKAKGGKGYLPLHYACATNSSTDVVQKLLDTFPASIRMRDTNDLMIPLHFACKWNSSTDIIEILASAYPEGKQVRDIYAKTPVDYANELGGQDRSAAIKTLEKSYAGRSSDRSYARSTSESDASLSDVVSVASKKIHRELKTTKQKLELATSELHERERKFSVQFGAEQTKVSQLATQKDLLEEECAQARVIQDEQKEKIHLLQEEVHTLKSLEEVHKQKKVMLESKIEELEQEKTAFKNGAVAKDSAQIRKNLTAKMVEQEVKFKAMLVAEQRKIDGLQKKAKEAEVTHRHYTMALLQEHEKEVSRFEELTSRFKVLEGQLRQEIKNERSRRVAAQPESSEGGDASNEELEAEREKVAFLEAHITKVNDLLEAEQKRFIELESILKETLAIENEQREEIETEFREKETEYQERIEIETQKRSQLEEAYSDVADKLKEEIKKTSELQVYEMELKKELEEDQKKIAGLELMQEKSEKALESERQKVKEMTESEANSRLLLAAEELKVKELEASVEEMKNLLKEERESVEVLKTELAALKAVYEKELNRIKVAEEADAKAQSEYKTLNDKVTILEKEESAIKTEISRVEATKQECVMLKAMLESEKEQVEKLVKSESDVRGKLNAEQEKLKALEEQIEKAESDDDDKASTIEERLAEQQATLDHQKYEVTALAGKHALLTTELETEKESTRRLEATIEEKEELLEAERAKVEVLVKEHGDIRATLAGEREKLKEAKSKADQMGEQLFFEKDSMEEMQRMVDQAKIDIQCKVEQVASLEKEEEESGHALTASKKELTESTEEVAKLKEALKIEERKVTEMANALREVQDLVQAEKNRVNEYKRLLEAQKHLSLADQDKIRELERVIEGQLVDIGFGKEENIKLEKDLAETKSLLDAESKKVMELLDSGGEFDGSRVSALYETEQNKVKALEHSCEQLMSLLDFEKKHVLSLEEKQEELKEQNESGDEELVATKKALEWSQLKVKQLSHEIEGFEDMKKELIRLSFLARQRDLMMAAMLYAVGDAKGIKGQGIIQNAAFHIDELERRGVVDLAGHDEIAFQDRESRQLVAYESAARRRTIRNIILPLVVAGGLFEYHHHDPSHAMAREFASTSMHTLGNLPRTFGASFAANMGQLAAAISESTAMRETVAQIGGMRRVNMRR